MSKLLIALALMCASLQAQVTEASTATNAEPSAVRSASSVNAVIEWNRTLLATPACAIAGRRPLIVSEPGR
jgi:hypothetical protein